MARHEPQDPAGRLDAEGIPEDDLPPGMAGTGGDYEGEMAPRDYPLAALDYGTTAGEEAAGESLRRRVAREHAEEVDVADEDAWAEPGGDPDADLGAQRILASPDGDGDGELLGSATGEEAGLSAEEDAVHIERE